MTVREKITGVRIKVCCIGSVEEANRALELGADHLGLVSEMPSGPGVISDEAIAGIVAQLPPHASTVLLTSRMDAGAIIAQQRACHVSALQLVDRPGPAEIRLIRSALPDVRIIQVVHVTGEGSVEEAVRISPVVDALLLDSGNPSAPRKELGGTGRVHDWSLSRRIVDLSPVPVYLAGGLNPGNVADAVRTVRPYGVDVCTGVRTGGGLDPDKLRLFVAAVRSAV